MMTPWQCVSVLVEVVPPAGEGVYGWIAEPFDLGADLAGTDGKLLLRLEGAAGAVRRTLPPPSEESLGIIHRLGDGSAYRLLGTAWASGLLDWSMAGPTMAAVGEGVFDRSRLTCVLSALDAAAPG